MPSGHRGWWAPLLLAVVATTLTLVLLAGVGEWAVRHRERTRASAPGTMSKLFYRHTRLMHGLERGLDYYGWVHIGRQGFRGARDVTQSPADSVFRIIAVGGSTTFDGNTSGDSSAWPARLEQILDSVGAPMRFEVLNAGVPGFQVLDDLVRLQTELYAYEPDLIILFQGHNDLFNTLSHARQGAVTTFDPRPGEVATIYPWQRWLERRSLLYHKLSSRLQALRFGGRAASNRAETSPERYRAVVDSGTAAFSRSVRMYLATAQALGIPVVIPQVVYVGGGSANRDSAAVAVWSNSYGPPAVIWDGYARYDAAARAVAAERGAAYIAATDSVLWQADSFTRGDPVHFNDQGAWRMARHIARAIRELPEVRQGAEARLANR